MSLSGAFIVLQKGTTLLRYLYDFDGVFHIAHNEGHIKFPKEENQHQNNQVFEIFLS